MNIRGKQMKKIIKTIICILGLSMLLSACTNSNPDGVIKNDKREVVIYTSVDQNYSESLFEQFEDETGIIVKAVYDIESSKTTGLINRLKAEKDNPICDVFWNNEFVQTMELDSEGMFETLELDQMDFREDIFKEDNANWIGFGGRSRVLLVNTKKVEEEDMPKKLSDLLNPKWKGEEVVIAQPLFGTSFTHGASLFAELGEEEAKGFYSEIILKNIKVVDGNSVVRDMVSDGRALFGLTDTDDSFAAIKNGAPVKIVFPDQGDDEMGTLVIPNTLSKIKGCSNENEANELIDFLLGEKVYTQLVDTGYFATSRNSKEIKRMDVTYEDIYTNLDIAREYLTDYFLK